MSTNTKPLIGLTGGIGSGKSSVAEHFSDLGITIIDADQASREVVKVGSPALEKISAHFGREVLNPDQSLDRSKLRHIVFADPAKRKWLQSIMYPITNEYLKIEINKAISAYAILMNPLLIESQQFRWCDRIAVVDVSIDTQIKRTMERDDNSRELVKSIIEAQIGRTKRLEYADDVINNDEAPEGLAKKIYDLHQSYLRL